MPPRVTVIIPTRDRVPYLGAAIDSVLDQRMGDLELIVVDDGSTDETPALLAGIRDARLRRLRQDPRGISAAMNAGLRAARGAYIARLDSDDVWEPDFLRVTTALLDARPEVGVAYAKGQAMDADGRPLAHQQGMPPRFADDHLRSMAFEDFTCNIAVVARRACFEPDVAYDESLPGNEDWDMWLRVARRHRFAFVDRVLAYYRWHDGNTTGPRSALFRAIVATRTVPLDKLFQQTDLSPELRAMRPFAYENAHLSGGRRLLHAGDLAGAGRAFARAARAGGRPLYTVARVLWLALILPGAARLPGGEHLVRRLGAARRRLAP